METDATPGNAPRTRRGIPTARNVDHFGLTVPDLEGAIRFFVDVLGCELLYRAGPFEDAGDWMKAHLNAAPGATLVLAALRCGPTANVELLQFKTADGRTEPPRTSDAGAGHLAFYVEDLDAAIAYLEEQPGVEVLGGPTTVEGQPSEDLRFVYFLTPWGTPMELASWPEGMPYERGTPARLYGPAPSWEGR
jgi:catechol 2,3-dioxygenase-like lactoylglutathione lyase family enzyme